MTGGQKAAAIIALVVITMAAFNWSLWRRLKAAQAQRIGWTDADFEAMLVAGGVSPLAAAKTRDLVAGYYGKGISPHPDDDFAAFLAMDETEVQDVVATGCEELGFPRPDAATIPLIRDVRDLAGYLDSVVRQRDAA